MSQHERTLRKRNLNSQQQLQRQEPESVSKALAGDPYDKITLLAEELNSNTILMEAWER